MTGLQVASFIFISVGIVILIISTFGLFKYKYVLNRMHIAAQCDSLAIFLITIGVCMQLGISFSMFKVILILIFTWITSPVCSHIVAKLELGSLEDEDEDKFRIEDRETKEDV